MGDLGGYGIAELPPAGPLFARGPSRALGQKGNPWEVVRNSISAHVTHAEITHFLKLVDVLKLKLSNTRLFYDSTKQKLQVLHKY